MSSSASLNAKIPKDFSAKGNLFVFVDEAHRTQSGKMHDAMKKLLPARCSSASPARRCSRPTRPPASRRSAASSTPTSSTRPSQDGVVLDLRYEARNIDQHLTSPAQVDKWFEVKTKGMTDLSKAELKKRWGTMQKVVSAPSRAPSRSSTTS